MSEYPSANELRKIRDWAFDQPDSFLMFMNYVRSVGYYWSVGQYWPLQNPFGWFHRGRTYRIATGGWSGNECIISSMKDNWIFWSVCWQSSRRGGWHVFKLPNQKTYFKGGAT